VLSTRGEANVGAIMPKIKSAVSDRSTGVQIDLASAENWLIRPEVIVICKEAISSQLTPQSFLYPRAFAGFPEVLDAFSEFFNARFNPKIKIETSHLATAPGAASCVDAVLYNICNPGDGVLVPGPYWSKFPQSVLEPPLLLLSGLSDRKDMRRHSSPFNVCHFTDLHARRI
jgi:aspartate/methionine/tyrosine aminotransferase